MKIAIIGAGLAGLAAGWYLTKSGCKITFFEKEGIGRGASGVAAGLVHPYVGQQARLSLFGQQACQASKSLVLEVAPWTILEEGIVRLSTSSEQATVLRSYRDVRPLGADYFLIESGLTIDTRGYLEALFASTKADLCFREVKELDSLSQFDAILVTAGHAAEDLLPEYKSLTVKKKGQILDVRLERPMRSTISKTYLAKGIEEGLYHWGSTYEREYESELPEKETALSLLEKHNLPFSSFPTILGCRAAVRLTRKVHYFPIATKVRKNVWWFGALGSRGLLYHAFLGRKIAEAILHNDESGLPKECRLDLLRN